AQEADRCCRGTHGRRHRNRRNATCHGGVAARRIDLRAAAWLTGRKRPETAFAAHGLGIVQELPDGARESARWGGLLDVPRRRTKRSDTGRGCCGGGRARAAGDRLAGAAATFRRRSDLRAARGDARHREAVTWLGPGISRGGACRTGARGSPAL